MRNVIESMVVVDFDGILDLDDLPLEFSGGEPAAQSPSMDGQAARAGYAHR